MKVCGNETCQPLVTCYKIDVTENQLLLTSQEKREQQKQSYAFLVEVSH